MINGFLLGACTFEQAVNLEDSTCCNAETEDNSSFNATAIICGPNGNARAERVTAPVPDGSHRTTNRSFDRRRGQKGGETIRRIET